MLRVCHADDPAEMALGVDPTQGVLENVELTGIIGDDHGVGQQAAGDDGSDHGRLGDPPTLTGAEAEAVQVPRRIVGKAPGSGGEQSGDDAFRHAVFDQVGQRRGIDHVVGVAQQVQEVQPALRRPGQAKRSLPMCVVYSLAPAWRAPVSSTVTQAAVANPASRRASFSLWKASLLAVRRVTI